MTYSWNKIVDPGLKQEVDVAKHFFIDAMSDEGGEDIADRLTVESLSLCKSTQCALQHEIIIIQAVDSRNPQYRPLFSLHRMPGAISSSPTTGQNAGPQYACCDKLAAGLSGLLPPPSRPASPLSNMEEGRLLMPSATTPSANSYPPVSLSASQLSLSDTISLKAVQALQAAKDKSGALPSMLACDWLEGENFTTHTRQACGQNARFLLPKKEVLLFELVLLAQVVHEHAPKYTYLGTNCFYYCSYIFAAAAELSHSEESLLHETDISGRFWGFRVNEIDSAELSQILRKYKDARTAAYGEVKITTQTSAASY